MLASRIERRSEARDHHFLGEFALSGTAVAERVDKRQVFVENGIAESGFWRHSVERFKRCASRLPFDI